MSSLLPPGKDQRRPATLVLLVGSEETRGTTRTVLLDSGVVVAEASTAYQAAALYRRINPTTIIADDQSSAQLSTLLPDAWVVAAEDLGAALLSCGAPRPIERRRELPAGEHAVTALAELSALCEFTGHHLGLVMLDVVGNPAAGEVVSRNVREGDLVVAWRPDQYVVAFIGVDRDDLRGIGRRLAGSLTRLNSLTQVRVGVADGVGELTTLVSAAAADLQLP